MIILKYLTVLKIVKGPYVFFEIQFVANIKKLEGVPLETLKIFEKKSDKAETSLKNWSSERLKPPSFCFSDLKKSGLTSVSNGSRSYKLPSNSY